MLKKMLVLLIVILINSVFASEKEVNKKFKSMRVNDAYVYVTVLNDCMNKTPTESTLELLALAPVVFETNIKDEDELLDFCNCFAGAVTILKNGKVIDKSHSYAFIYGCLWGGHKKQI